LHCELAYVLFRVQFDIAALTTYERENMKRVIAADLAWLFTQPPTRFHVQTVVSGTSSTQTTAIVDIRILDSTTTGAPTASSLLSQLVTFHRTATSQLYEGDVTRFLNAVYQPIEVCVCAPSHLFVSMGSLSDFHVWPAVWRSSRLDR
jgi:hypothetical protein